MDLRKYYLENVSEDEYYYNFYDLIKNINRTFDFFDDYEEDTRYKFWIDDIEDAIKKFKSLCMPECENHNNEDKCWFYLVSFYLYKCGIVIEEFPRIIEHPPKNTFDFVNVEIRSRLLAEGKDSNGKIQWNTRRKLIASLRFVQRASFVELDDAIERKFQEISNRQATFQEMSMDEKLAEIANLIEHMLKKNDKFISLDYSTICFDYINDAIITKYRKKLHCFRHSAIESINERESMTKEQKTFLIDLGITIVKVIYELLEKK